MEIVKAEGVITNLKHNIDDIDNIIKKHFRKHKDKFTSDAFKTKMLQVSSKYLRRMQLTFTHLKYDVYNFLSKFNYKFTIDFDFLFHLSFGIYRLICFDNKFDMFMTLIYVVHTFLGNKLHQYMDIVCNWCDKFILDLKSFGKVKSESLPEYSPEFSLKKWFDLIIENKLINSIKELLLNLVGLKFFSREMTSRFVKTLGPAKPVSLIELCRNVVETVEDFISFAINYKSSGSFISALSQNDPTIAFLEKTYAITLKVRNVYLGDDSNFQRLEASRSEHVEDIGASFDSSKIAAKDFIIEVRNAVIEGDSIARKMKVSTAFKSRLYLLKEIRDELALKMRSKNRRAPFGLIVHGDPSIGKSSILVHIYKLWSKHKGLIYSRDLVYDRNPKSKYWTNHDPLSQPIIHYPELGSVNSNIVKNKGDETIDEMLMVSDTQPFSGEVANAEDKGKCMIMPDLLVIDCNDPKMNLEFTNNNPAAIRRRFVYIEAKVKPEYATLTALDESKIPENLEDKMDLWNFRVYRQIPDGIVKSEKVSLTDGPVDIFGLSSKLMELFAEHDVKQDGFGKAVAEDINKYLAKSESESSSIYDTLFYAVFFFFIIYPVHTIFVCLMYLMINIILEYNRQYFHFPLFLKFKALSFISNNFVDYKLKIFFSNTYDTFSVLTLFSYYSIKSLMYESEEYYEYKLRFNNLSLMRKCSMSLLLFTISLSFIKIILSIFNIAHDVVSEGNIVESSGDFSEDKINIDEEISIIEKQSQSSFPLPKKKREGDKDYDVIENTLPRYITEKRNLENPDEINNSVNKNLRFLKISYDGLVQECIGLGICKDYMIVNKHCVPKSGAQIVSSHIKEYASSMKYHTVDLQNFYDVGDDLYLFRFRGELFKDIRFILTDFKHTNISMEARFKNHKVRAFFESKDVTVHHSRGNYILHGCLVYEYPEHKNGDCGYPLLLTVNKRTFLGGIHTGGGTTSSNSFSTLVSKSILDEAINKLDESLLTSISSEGSLRLSKESSIKAVTSKSPLLYEDCPGISVIGSMSNYNQISPKSTLIESPLLDDIETLIGKSPYREDGNKKYLPPLMKSKRVNGQYIAPYNNWVKKVGVVKKTLNPKIMESVSLAITCYLLKELKKKGVDKLTPYKLSVAQNGYPENFYVRAMRNSTSGGLLFPGKKKDHTYSVELDFKKDSVMPDNEIKEQVLEIINSYNHEECSHDLVGAQLKDEPRTFEKSQAGKTRIFAMSSYPMTLVNRMYLMPFYALMCEYREIFGTRVGINMHSNEADKMYNDLVSFSKNIMEGDYGGYDTSMPVDIGLIANSIVFNVLKQLGYNEFALKIVKGILCDNLYPTMAMEGNIIQVPGFQPSGKYATAEDNSLRGLILMYYAFAEMCTPLGKGSIHNKTIDYNINDFFKLIKPETYGDDMLASVKDSISLFYNNITYSSFVSDVYGMEFTTADKHGHTSKFVDCTKISFLKRSFVYNPLLGRIVAVLDRDSFVKSLSYILPSKEVSLEVQIVETCQSVLRELFFYHDKLDEYNQVRQLFVNTLEKRTSFLKTDLYKLFPTGEELYEIYKN
ncbi:hypothetical protein 1 [Beihai picorna-like virus 63]|uniref:hypothetical protein 1 n=1 Tax=Beihai picorna-like virus 63 TaxID=1922609 RepID=UPI00090A5F85|nr:hypothetical protein 1 [Beihai picorna-like virus 63]APG76888.1 hypothetical protein 1 [Beihai picorna-like virus 63]